MSGKSSEAGIVCFSFTITDDSHCLGRGPGREAGWSPSLVQVIAPCCHQPTGHGMLQLCNGHLGSSPWCHIPLPSVCQLGSLLAGGGPAEGQTFADRIYKVLSFCDLTRTPGCGAQTVFPRLSALGWWKLHQTWALRPGSGSQPCHFAAK